jgi:formate/nitrite transporter FocA (FNT family)
MKEPARVHATDPPAFESSTDLKALESENAERRKVHERQSLSARGVHDTLLLEGADEIERPWSALAWSGLASGLSMGLSLVAEGVLRQHLPDVSWRPLVSKLGYTVGFLAVTLGRQQLYTETTLTAYLPLAEHRDRATALNVAKLWIVVLAANMIGAYAFAWAAAHTGAFGPELQRSFSAIGTDAARHGFAGALVKAIFGGWMIALMVWLLPSAESARIWIIMIITYLARSGRPDAHHCRLDRDVLPGDHGRLELGRVPRTLRRAGPCGQLGRRHGLRRRVEPGPGQLRQRLAWCARWRYRSTPGLRMNRHRTRAQP